MTTTVSLEQAADDFRNSIDRFVEAYKIKNVQHPDQYPLELPEGNSGLWTEFMLDYFNNGTV